MNLSQLKYVKAVADTGSFSRASENCFVTQPSLSNAIAQLEEELGGRIFFRTTHNVSITPFGERMLPTIAAVLDAQADLVNTAKGLVDPAQKLIRIGFCPLVNIHLLTSVLEPFKNRHQDVDIVMKECFQDDLRLKLSGNKVDVAFVPQGFEMRQAGKAEFYTEELYFLPSAKSLSNSSAESVTLEQIANETFTIAGEGCGLVTALREMFRSAGLEFCQYAGHALSYSVLEDWASLGIGATILPRSKISKDNATARLLLLENDKPASVTFETVWNKQSPQSTHFKEFLHYFKKTVPEHLKGLTI